MQKIVCQLSPAAHAKMNNGALMFSLLKLNLGYKLVLDVQVLPVPRLWVRVPFLGEIVLGFTRFEVCSDVKHSEPDYLGFDFRLKPWGQLKAENEYVWENIKKPFLYRVQGNPTPSTTEDSLVALGLPQTEVERLVSFGDVPTLLPRGLTHIIDGV